jgi:hypothetical protein
MARYSAFLGRRVEVHYRAGDVVLPASGTFVADSGRSIFLEQSLVQRGQQRHFRWEIPYRYIVRLEEKTEAEEDGGSGSAGKTTVNRETSEPARAATSEASGVPALLPFPHPPRAA